MGARTVFKDVGHAGQAFVRFLEVFDTDFRSRIDLLIEFTRSDIDRKRVLRNDRQNAIAIDLSIGSRNEIGARVEPPFEVRNGNEADFFPISLPA